MSLTYRDPLLEILSEWVAGGGDPDFAFTYALIQVNPVSQVKVVPSLDRLPMVRKDTDTYCTDRAFVELR